MMLFSLLGALLGAACSLSSPGSSTDESIHKVKVFVLAGQSNMEGKGYPEPVAWQITQKEYRERYTHFIKDGDYDSFTRTLQASLAANPNEPVYDWSVREDVWVKYLGQHGNLTVGYAAPSKCFGPEYEFGHVMGDHFEDQVLLIKTAWGGKSLGKDFLPPSAKQPSDDEFAAMVQARNEQIAKENDRNRSKHVEQGRAGEFKPRPDITDEEVRGGYGHYYRAMIQDVKQTRADLPTLFPGYQGQGAEIVGLVWFQGWNDQFNDSWCDNYGANMACFIRDVRKDLDAPDMRAVIGVVGFDGPNDKPLDGNGNETARTKIKRGQAAMQVRFQGSVRSVTTAEFWDMEADAIFRGPGGWSKDPDRWREHGNDFPYHYYGSPWFFSQAGEAFGKAMVELVKD